MKISMKTAAMIGLVLCFISSPAAAQPADTPWPMFHHDLNHTGLSTHYGPDTPGVKWVFPTSDKIHGSPVIGGDGTVYIGTHGRHSSTTGSKLFAIHPNGTEKWQWNPGHSIDSTPAVALDGTLYVGCWDKSLYAVHPNGTVKWEFSDPSGSFVFTSPAIAPDGTVYIGNNNNRLYAVNPDGTLKWSYKTNGAIHSSPAVDADGTVYIGSNDKKLYAINPDGSLKWKYQTGSWVESSPAIGTDDTIYVGSYDKKLHAINPDGTLKWKYLTGGRIRSSPAIGADGTIYVGSSYDKKLHAINPDGTLKWDYTTDSYIQSSPAIDADGTIYVGSFDRNLYAINPDGSLLWKHNTGDRIDYSSPAIASDGTIYIGNWNGYVYAFGPGIQLNLPPVLDPVGDRTLNETETVMIDPDATDLDGDALYFSCNRTDLFTDFDPVTGTGNWTPDYGDAGTYPVDFGVSDGEGGVDNETIEITVLAANRPPVLEQIGDKSVDENSLLEFTVNATDPDGDALAYSASNLPDGATFNPHTQTFSWTPTFDQSGTHPDVHFAVSDGELIDWENITISVNDTNRPPVLEQIGDKSVDEDFLLEFTVNATDPDGDVLTYSASNLPDGAVFNSTTHTFSWTLTFDQTGMYPDVHFEVSDGELTDWENITIRVNGVGASRPPVLDQIGDKSIDETYLLEFTVNATDLDGDTLTYSASNLPDGAAFYPNTRIFSWTPTFDQSGTHHDVHFETSDGELTDWENITISVSNTNRPPVLDPIGNRTINENSSLEFTVNASDPDGDVLAYSASNLPDGAAFNPHTRTFTWMPTFDKSGTHPDVHFEVSDGESMDWVNITITVNNINRPPVLDQIGDRIIDENCSLEFTVNASDPDGDALTYSASNLPDGAVFNPTTQTFSWTPTLYQSGTYPDVYFEVSDGDLTDPENITIRVIDADASPKIRIIVPDSEVMFQQQFTINVTVDPMMTEIYGVQYILSFDNSVLHAEWQNEGTFLNHDGAETNVYINTIDNGAGTISFAATRVDVTTGVTSPGTLAVIKFTAIQKGICSDLTLDGVIVADENGARIDPVVIINSSICVDENQPPLAAGKSIHRYNNEGGRYLCKVYFDGAGSSDPDGEIIYWGWSFGDGNYGTGELVDHVYQSWKWNGTGYDPFTAILTVTDDGDPHQLDDATSFDIIVYTAGDANGDGKVNILDATIVGLEWGASTTCGAYCWEGDERADQADLNNDCKVNILDAVIIGTCWGHTAW